MPHVNAFVTQLLSCARGPIRSSGHTVQLVDAGATYLTFTASGTRRPCACWNGHKVGHGRKLLVRVQHSHRPAPTWAEGHRCTGQSKQRRLAACDRQALVGWKLVAYPSTPRTWTSPLHRRGNPARTNGTRRHLRHHIIFFTPRSSLACLTGPRRTPWTIWHLVPRTPLPRHAVRRWVEAHGIVSWAPRHMWAAATGATPCRSHLAPGGRRPLRCRCQCPAGAPRMLTWRRAGIPMAPSRFDGVPGQSPYPMPRLP
mmetsp:Transcript_111166/g.314572  ORF Transcript_111166/g.314572 Transcript_111166/m.314572 type:complete len:256 (-) Transcript_111166:119-886(-)